MSVTNKNKNQLLAESTARLLNTLHFLVWQIQILPFLKLEKTEIEKRKSVTSLHIEYVKHQIHLNSAAINFKFVSAHTQKWLRDLKITHQKILR